jgi:hypothetical protein
MQEEPHPINLHLLQHFTTTASRTHSPSDSGPSPIVSTPPILSHHPPLSSREPTPKQYSETILVVIVIVISLNILSRIAYLCNI